MGTQEPNRHSIYLDDERIPDEKAIGMGALTVVRGFDEFRLLIDRIRMDCAQYLAGVEMDARRRGTTILEHDVIFDAHSSDVEAGAKILRFLESVIGNHAGSFPRTSA